MYSIFILLYLYYKCVFPYTLHVVSTPHNMIVQRANTIYHISWISIITRSQARAYFMLFSCAYRIMHETTQGAWRVYELLPRSRNVRNYVQHILHINCTTARPPEPKQRAALMSVQQQQQQPPALPPSDNIQSSRRPHWTNARFRAGARRICMSMFTLKHDKRVRMRGGSAERRTAKRRDQWWWCWWQQRRRRKRVVEVVFGTGVGCLTELQQHGDGKLTWKYVVFDGDLISEVHARVFGCSCVRMFVAVGKTIGRGKCSSIDGDHCNLIVDRKTNDCTIHYMFV